MAFLSLSSLPSLSTNHKRGYLNTCRSVSEACDKSNQPHPSVPVTSLPTSPTSLDSLLQTIPQHPHTHDQTPALVHLVGTGPGDPSLLTLRALHHMKTANIILYDRLVSSQILNLCNPSAQLIYVGKRAGYHTRTQQEIHQLLCFFAERRQKVIRLKGGDPFIFGRGGEEMDFLEDHGIKVSVSPGITAAAGIAAELGIPLTMRNIAHSVRFITGHTKDGRCVDIGAVDHQTTYVIYMGLGQLPFLIDSFTGAGLSPKTPCIAVERGTTHQQRIVTAQLTDICQKVDEAALESPTLVLIGEVVRLSKVWGLDLVEGRLVEDVDLSNLGIELNGLKGASVIEG